MTFTAQNTATFSESFEVKPDPLNKAAGVYVTVHGHFYQPPRENPYLDTIERQPNAHPFHDWNERIHHECYRANAFARILNKNGEVVGIVNNFEYLSFNIGPTLMSWLEKYDVEVYQRILEADRKSCDRLKGHGNAIAQVYNHMILPLANQRDKYTQIRWGKAEFRHRFGRDPEGMWLAETAVDSLTLKALIDEGIRFIILAPSQAERCRPFPTEEEPEPKWLAVGGAQIDPTRPYRCFINDREYIDIFFYDGPISRDMGFDEVLFSSYNLLGRIGQAVRGDHRSAQLISVATDGETFGHHKSGTEKTLAYAFVEEFPKKNWTVTNFAHYLSISPPTWEVQLKPVTAWSCAHGVDRWQDDCGCAGGGEWHQKWRRPLRNALNWLRDRLSAIYEEIGSKFFRDPWSARDEYIQVILDRSVDRIEQFLQAHQNRQLDRTERVDALRLLEMQRHALLMFTSCGWFFEEISRVEGVQILRYASRAIELAAEVGGIQLEREFINLLALAPSNILTLRDGAEVYRKLVLPAQIDFKQVAAHYAMSSLFTNYPQQQRIYCYNVQQLDYQKQQMGMLTLAVGQVSLVSEISWESNHFVFAVLHLGGWDFHCCIQNFTGRSAYTKLKEKLFETLKQASVVQLVLEMSHLFDQHSFGLQHLFAEERHRIMHLLTEQTKQGLDQLYTQVYRDNYGILVAFQREELPVPQELQVAAEIALSHRCSIATAELEQTIDELDKMAIHLSQLLAIAAEANHLRCQLKVPEAKKILECLVLQLLWKLLYDGDPSSAERYIQSIEQIIDIGDRLNLGLSLDRAQELYQRYFYSHIIPNCLDSANDLSSCRWNSAQIPLLLALGKKLAVDVHSWFDRLS